MCEGTAHECGQRSAQEFTKGNGAYTENLHFSWAPLTITIDVLTRCNRSIVVVSMKVWVDHMYVRIAEITSTSDMQFKMLMAFVENVLLPRNIEAGQLSGEIFRTSDNSCFVVSRFTSKEEADKIMQIMKAEMEELRGNNRIRFLEGERFMHLSRTD